MQSGSHLLGRCLAHSGQGAEALCRCLLLQGDGLLVRPLWRPSVEERPCHLACMARKITKDMGLLALCMQPENGALVVVGPHSLKNACPSSA